MLRVELHCHSIFSKDSLTPIPSILDRCREIGIDKIAITDHNTAAGAQQAAKLDRDLVMIGEEIMTSEGELLAFFLQEEIPPGLTPEKTIELLRQQDAFISVSHPFDVWRSGHWKLENLLRILPLLDAIEVFNARCMQNEFNHHAQEFAREHEISGTVGSDAHAAFEIGRATLLMPEFHDRQSMRVAIRSAKQEVRLSSWYVHLYSRYAVWQKGKAKRNSEQPGLR